MKKTITLLSGLLLASLIFWQCSPTIYTKADFPEKYLSFGKGGGFIGAPTTYHLLPNGQVFKSEGLLADTIEVLAVEKGVAKAFFKTADDLSLAEMDFDHPGNMYQFINYHTGKGEHRVVWGENNTKFKLADEVRSLYKDLNNKIAVKKKEKETL